MATIDLDNDIIESQYEVPCISLFYPRNEGNAKSIEVDLIDVRAATSIVITYDFDRNGWAISKPTKIEWMDDEDPNDRGMVEVAFIDGSLPEPRPWL